MLIGQTLLIPATGSVEYFGPWMPRQGDSMGAVFELLRQSAGGWTMKVFIETKNAEDPDSSLTSLGNFGPTGVGTFQGTFTGCLELVRYRYLINGSGTTAWIHGRNNPPIWQPN